MFTLATVAAFAVASTFSSRISTLTGNAVLIAPGVCGTPDMSKLANMTATSLVMRPHWAEQVSSSTNYMQRCYLEHGSDSCTLFVKKALPAESLRNATCPFTGDICKSKNSNILLDTGYIDSSLGFGINVPRNKSWLYRRVMHCAPLRTDGYRKPVPKLNGGMDIPYMQYFYGERDVTSRGSSTYQYPILDISQIEAENFTGADPDYTVKVLSANYWNGSIDTSNSDFNPIEPLRRPDADLYLIFLSANAVMFANETDDPWYAAHHRARINASSNVEIGVSDGDLWFADEPASPLGCAVQHQYCNPQSAPKECTPLSSAPDFHRYAPTIWPDEEERSAAMYSVFSGYLAATGMLKFVIRSGLESGSSKTFATQGPIPDDQWQRDVERWNNVTLATVQQTFLDAASGSSDPRVNDFTLGPQTDEERSLCRNQMMLSTAYTNFSILGLAMVFVVGGLIIALSYALEPAVRRIQRRRDDDGGGGGTYASFEWTVNETLQLQRLAHEELGIGRWTNCDRDVPITEGRDRLAMLDLDNLRHPKLKAPPVPFEQMLAGLVGYDKEDNAAPAGESTAGEIATRWWWSKAAQAPGTWKQGGDEDDSAKLQEGEGTAE